MEELPLKFRDERELRSTLGVSLNNYNKLLPAFSIELAAYFEEKYEKQIADGTRKRKPGGGRKPKLATAADKLVFGLYYMKNYPKFDVLANKFDLSRSVAHDNACIILPIIERALGKLGVLPKRGFNSVEEFEAFFKKIEVETLLIDVTERQHFRYKEKKKRPYV